MREALKASCYRPKSCPERGKKFRQFVSALRKAPDRDLVRQHVCCNGRDIGRPYVKVRDDGRRFPRFLAVSSASDHTFFRQQDTDTGPSRLGDGRLAVRQRDSGT